MYNLYFVAQLSKIDDNIAQAQLTVVQHVSVHTYCWPVDGEVWVKCKSSYTISISALRLTLTYSPRM